MKVIHGLKFLVVFTLSLFISACGGGSSSSSSDDPVTSPTPTPSSSKLELLYEENIGETLYYNGATGSQFTYKPTFVFKNTSGSSVTVNSVDVSDTAYLTNVAYQCNGVSQALPCTLSADQTFSVNGVLADFSEANNSKTLSLTLKDAGSDTLGQYEITTQFVKYLDGYVAVRTINSNTDATSLYLAAAYGGNTVNFAANGDGLYVGTTGASTLFKTDDFNFPSKDGGVVYLPYGSSGTLYLSFEQFTSEPTPNPNAPGTPGFFTAELTYLQQVPSPPAKCTATGETCEQLTLDTTYVNYIQYFGSASTLGTSSYLPNTVLTGKGYAGAKDSAISKGTAAVYKDIYDVYQTFDTPWKYNAAGTVMTDNYFATSKSGGVIPADTTILYAPIQLFQAGQATNVPMANDYYDGYINALWDHLKNNPIYVDANSITNPAKSNCILKGQVDGSNNLVFSPVSGNDCPSWAYVVSSLVTSPTTPFANCTGSTAPVSGGTNCADTVDTPLTFTKFNTCDFVTAAGSASCSGTTIDESNFVTNTTLWGPNGTFRAIIGRAVAAYQAAGLLPICSGSGMTPIGEGTPMNQTNSREAVATGNAFQNPSCLTGLSDSKPVYNLYSKELSNYVQAYTYSYGDFLGMDATITYSRNAFSGNDSVGETCATTPDSPFCHLPKALPITLKIH
jgi:hypothetical protein